MFDPKIFKLKVIFNKVKMKYDMGFYNDAIKIKQAIEGIAESI